MTKYAMRNVPENCTGCLRCQLACSELRTGTFALHAARLQVLISDKGYTVRFSDDCNSCGVCSDHCLYDALLKSPGEAAK
jgi:predicted molibdopterin-dependent oxidoreductase YjgC